MNIYEGMAMATFVMVAIIMISQYINNNTPRLCDVIQIMNVLRCHEVRVYKNGRRIRTSELIEYINSPVKAHEKRDGILYIVI